MSLKSVYDPLAMKEFMRTEKSVSVYGADRMLQQAQRMSLGQTGLAETRLVYHSIHLKMRYATDSDHSSRGRGRQWSVLIDYGPRCRHTCY